MNRALALSVGAMALTIAIATRPSEVVARVPPAPSSATPRLPFLPTPSPTPTPEASPTPTPEEPSPTPEDHPSPSPLPTATPTPTPTATPTPAPHRIEISR